MSHTIARIGAGATLALVGTMLGATTAQAAVAAPANLTATPEGASIPALSWSPVAKATGYQVQVDNDSGFGSPEFNLSTVNFRATPTTALRSGTQHWRVRTVKGTDTSAWREGSPFSVSPISVPVPTSPAEGANLPQPGSPPLLQWQGSPGASSYTVEVDGDSDFVGSKSYSTKSTSLVVPDPLGEGDWFWRVTAVKSAGLVSLPSGQSSFNILPLAKPALVSPTDSVDTKVSDVVLDWEPVPGARTYDVQISDGPSFDPGSTTTATGVQGTRFSPKITLNNDQFWWRVRAIDLNGQATTWAQTNFGFNRVFEHQSQAVYPLGSYSSPAPLTTSRQYYEWTPVPQASDYELIVANDINFSQNARSCRTSGTTYTPRSTADCGYKPTGTTFWMVRPLDKPYETNGLPGQYASVPQAITWTDSTPPPAAFDPSLEVQGMKVAVTGSGAGCASALCDNVPTTPVFSWDPMPGATSYQVFVGQDNKFTTSVLATKSVPIPTSSTMMTLEWRASGNSSTGDQLSALPDSSAGQAYHWYVRACGQTPSGPACGPFPVSSPFSLGTKAFRKVSPPVTGLTASNGAGTEISFGWDDYLATNLATAWNGETGIQSARGYHIQVDNEPSFQAPLLDDQVIDQTTYTAIDRLYPEGTLYWRVQATDSEGNGLTWSETRSLTKESPAVQLQSPGNGATVSGTVPLRWAPQAFAASYTVEVYKNNDRSFSSVNRLFAATVKTPAYVWTQPIPADPTAYVWRVRRTDADGNPGPWSAPYEFRSLGAAPVLTSPANGSWQPGVGTLFTWTDVPGAASYNLVATSATGSRLVSITTPGNAYATTKAIPTSSYTWTVTALDAGGKSLGTSLTGNFRVDATAPQVKTTKPTRTATPTSILAATFSEKVQGVGKKTMRLYQKGKKKPLKAKVVIKKGGRKAILKPKAKLKKGKTYLVKFTASRITDQAGNALVKPKEWSVTVE
jgi:hypothetical protein